MPTNNLQNEVREGYKGQRGGGKGGTDRPSTMDYYTTGRMSIALGDYADIPFHERVIHANHDLSTVGYPGYAKTYSKIARN